MSEAWVTALGAATSVGLDARTTCASIRAGLVRPVPLEGLKVLDGAEYEEVPVIGHVVGDVTRGFSAVGRWLQLLPLAIEDLCATGGLPAPALDAVFWSRTGCLLVVPPFGARFAADYHCFPQRLAAALLPPLSQRCRDVFAPAHLELHPTGQVGVLEAVALAQGWMDEGRCDRVAVLAVDSLVDASALSWLLEEGRLKSAASPTGCSPGEACCAFLLESMRSARARGAAGPRWGSVATAPPAGDDIQDRSERLAGVVRQAISQPVVSRAQGPIVTDLNGEEWRAATFAGIYPRTLHHTAWSDQPTVVPLVNTGDVGAATGALQVVVACRALSRGTIDGTAALLTMTGAEGAVGAAVVLRGQA